MSEMIRAAEDRLRRYNADEDNGFAAVYEASCREFATKLPAGLSCDVSDLAQASLDADRELLADAWLEREQAVTRLVAAARAILSSSTSLILSDTLRAALAAFDPKLE